MLLLIYQHSIRWMDNGQCAEVQKMENVEFMSLYAFNQTNWCHLSLDFGIRMNKTTWWMLFTPSHLHHESWQLLPDLMIDDFKFNHICCCCFFLFSIFYNLMSRCFEYGDSDIISCNKISLKNKWIEWRKVHHHKEWFFSSFSNIIIIKIK